MFDIFNNIYWEIQTIKNGSQNRSGHLKKGQMEYLLWELKLNYKLHFLQSVFSMFDNLTPQFGEKPLFPQGPNPKQIKMQKSPREIILESLLDYPSFWTADRLGSNRLRLANSRSAFHSRHIYVNSHTFMHIGPSILVSIHSPLQVS